jgi:hypothetical protein
LPAAAQPPAWVQAVTSAVAHVQSQQARPVVANPVRLIQAALDAGVNTVFDRLTKLLSRLPANQITDAVTGALLLVRRNLFDEMTTTNPVTDILRASGQWEGSLNPSDPWDDSLTYTVTAAPAHGSVQVNSDGTYVYTPADGYTGADSFTVAVADPGFDILHPFGADGRVAASPAAADPGFDIFRPYFGNGTERVEDVTVVVDPSKTFTYPSIKNVGTFPVYVVRTLYTIDNVPATRQKEDLTPAPRIEVEPNETYYVKNYYPDSRVRPPGPGVYFDYRLFVESFVFGDTFYQLPSRKDLKPFWTIEFTQEAGSSNTSTKVFATLRTSSVLKRYEYQITDIKDPNSSNSTQQVQLTFTGTYKHTA